MRHRPFFPHPSQLLLPIPAAAAAPVLNPIRRGSLEVTVLNVTRLNPLLQGDGVYCTMALGMFTLFFSCFNIVILFLTIVNDVDNSPWFNITPSETAGWVVLDIRVARHCYPSLGIQFQQQTSSVKETFNL